MTKPTVPVLALCIHCGERIVREVPGYWVTPQCDESTGGICRWNTSVGHVPDVTDDFEPNKTVPNWLKR